MNSNSPQLERRFRKHMEELDQALPELETQIDHLPLSVSAPLQKRLHDVEIMENAMQRDFHELVDGENRPDVDRVLKLKRLSKVIESETHDLQREVEFLSKGESITFEALSTMADRLLQRAKDLVHTISEMRRG